MKIYLASSWRNERQPAVLAALREAGHDVYDFRNPAPGDSGFGWTEICANWIDWTPNEFIRALEHPIADHGFSLDMKALRWCEACVLLLPCGRSAHLELGWACGAGKLTVVLVEERVDRKTDVTGLPCYPNGEPSGTPRESLPEYLIERWGKLGRPSFLDATNPFRDVREEETVARPPILERGWEPELMYKMCDLITDSLDIAIRRLNLWDMERFLCA